MNKKIFSGLLILFFSFLVASCDKDNEIIDHPPLIFELTTGIEENSPIILASEGVMKLEFKAENVKSISTENLPAGWEAKVNQEGGYIEVTAPQNDATIEGGLFTLTIKAQADGKQEKTEEVKFYWIKSFDDPKGTFILNEGNMTTENGSLIYITPEGFVIDNAYKLVNGTELGNVAQDMSIRDGKIYVISQNGDENAVGDKFENDGMLVIMNAKTLKKEKSFSKEELTGLTWPSHVAALDAQHVYIRDNGAAKGDETKGKIWCLNTETGSMTAVVGSDGALNSPLVTMDGKVYTYKPGSIFSYIWEISKDKNTVNRIKLPSYWVGALGIQAAGNGQLWTLGTNYGSQFMVKFDLTTQKELMKKNLLVKPYSGTSRRNFVAKDNTVYYAHDTSVYRLSFDEGASNDAEEMLDVSTLDSNARELYNGLGIHPVTGNVYVNTIKGVGPFFTTNHIWVFDFDKSKNEPIFKFEDYTSFPAGTFFPAN